jgi:tripartite-type tricarboxylate transporter receptor subunit TctC
VRTWALMPLAGLLLVSQLSTASAQSYPTRPIKMIVAIAAGSVTDVIMRAAANELADRLGQPIVIENQGGASGVPASPGLHWRRARRLHAMHDFSQYDVPQSAAVCQAPLLG